MTILTAEQRKQIDQEGYLILPALLSRQEVEQLRDRLETLWAEEGEEAGQENYIEPGVRRLANLANKGDIFRSIFAHPLVLAVAEAVMGPAMRLSMLNAREVPPQEAKAQQPFHSDTDDSGKPDAKGFYSCTAIWMLDDFTPENGATRLIPRTHLTYKVPKEALADTYAPHPDELVLTGKAGYVAVFNGHCWHAGGLNRTDRPRCAILAHYLRADIPRPADRRQHLSPEVRARMSPRELEILGLDEKQYLQRTKIAAAHLLKSLRTKLPIG
jgi:ectoine hydroxylase-related dioxygenase (phytanoyl-CoA dioxygenase family)